MTAPEIFKGGYNEDVDWWSLGITFYECLYGNVIYNHDDDRLGLLKAILFLETLDSLYRY
jgi:serine/threonine protein kinase